MKILLRKQLFKQFLSNMYNFEAKIVSGKGRGKRLGFPTINLHKRKLDINYGVYLVKIYFKNKKYKGLLHYGPKKTFNEGVSAEVYIKNFNLNIYNKIVNVEIEKKIRNIKKFKSSEDLIKQIKKDLEYV